MSGRAARLLALAVAGALATGLLLAGPSSADDGSAPAGSGTDPACASNPAACTVGTRPGTDAGPAVGSVDDATQGVVAPSVETERTLAAINQYTPESAVDSWAQAAAEGAVSVLGKISTWQDRVTTPAFDRSWWRDQYAVMFGLSLMLFAFLLVVVVARIGGPDGSVSAAQLLRDSGLRLWLVPALLAVAPVVLSLVQGTTAELARAFARQSDGVDDATTAFLTKMTALSSGFDAFGGAILALLVLLGILVFSLALLVEVAVASWGLNLLGLVVPIAVVMHLYPPWRRPLARVAGLMLGLMFTPVAVNFVYWTFFSATQQLADGLDLFGTALFVLIGTLLLCAAPVALMYLFPVVLPRAAATPAMAGVRTGPSDGVVSGTPRAVARLSDHFRAKESFVARPAAAAGGAPAAATTVGVASGGEIAGVRDRRETPRRALAADLPEDDTGPLAEAEAVRSHEQVAAQLGSRHVEEDFDPEPFDAPRPTEEARGDRWWRR